MIAPILHPKECNMMDTQMEKERKVDPKEIRRYSVVKKIRKELEFLG